MSKYALLSSDLNKRWIGLIQHSSSGTWLWNGNTTDLSDNLKGLIAALRADPSNEELANKVDQQLTFTLNKLEKLDIVRKIIKST